MTDYYADRIDSHIYGSRLLIYKRGDVDDVFYFRAKLEGKKGYIRRSCKTADADEAMRIAHQQYDELRLRHSGGLSVTKLTVEKFFNDWILRKQHNFTESRAKWKKGVFDRYLADYFGKQEISALNKKFVDGYWEYRLNFWNTQEAIERIEINTKRAGSKSVSSHNVAKKASFATLKSEASLINEVLRAATDDGHLVRTIKISAQDAVAKSDRGTVFRDTFTEHEWKVLTANLYNFGECKGKFADKRLHKLHRFQRKVLHCYVLLAASTGLRVGEIKQLQWGDFDTQANSSGERVFVVRVRGDTSKVRRSRAAVAHSAHIIKVINDYKELCDETSHNDLVFFNVYHGVKSAVDVSVAFKKFLMRVDYEKREGGLRFSHDKKARTLYSLRHFFAVSRLKQGVDVYALATSMGTGVEQIKNHYGRHISGDAFITELTKYQSKSGAAKKASAIKDLVGMVESGVIDEEAALAAFKRVSQQATTS
jgi:integrase